MKHVLEEFVDICRCVKGNVTRLPCLLARYEEQKEQTRAARRGANGEECVRLARSTFRLYRVHVSPLKGNHKIARDRSHSASLRGRCNWSDRDCVAHQRPPVREERYGDR